MTTMALPPWGGIFSNKKQCPCPLPAIPDKGQQSVKHAQGVKANDTIKFGMTRDPSAACCVSRFLGEKKECCNHIASGKPFEQEYVKALEKQVKETGMIPRLDPRVKHKLEKSGEMERLKTIVARMPPPSHDHNKKSIIHEFDELLLYL